MDYILIGLISLLIVLVIVVLFLIRKDSVNEANLIERLARFELSINKEIKESDLSLTNSLNNNFNDLQKRVEDRLIKINDRVNERLDDNFEKANKTFNNVIERLAKIDEAQKKIDSLGTDIVSLQSILTDKKTRGIFGEINLKHILSNVFGENNNRIYQLQYTMPNGSVVDSILFAPQPLGVIGIDSKFPMENYQGMVDKKISPENRLKYEKLFKLDMKKHIDAIAEKYIIHDFTTDQAILFLPAEAIFAELNAYHQDIIEYSYKKKVWITSPTTLMSTLSVIQMIIKNIERDKYTSIIHEEINKLGIEFDRYKDRWDKLARSIQAVNRDVADVQITSDKISKKFGMISKVEIENIKSIEEK